MTQFGPAVFKVIDWWKSVHDVCFSCFSCPVLMLKLFLTELMDSFLGHGLEGLPNAITVSGFVFSKSAVRKRKAADSDGVQLYMK